MINFVFAAIAIRNCCNFATADRGPVNSPVGRIVRIKGIVEVISVLNPKKAFVLDPAKLRKGYPGCLIFRDQKVLARAPRGQEAACEIEPLGKWKGKAVTKLFGGQAIRTNVWKPEDEPTKGLKIQGAVVSNTKAKGLRSKEKWDDGSYTFDPEVLAAYRQSLKIFGGNENAGGTLWQLINRNLLAARSPIGYLSDVKSVVKITDQSDPTRLIHQVFPADLGPLDAYPLYEGQVVRVADGRPGEVGCTILQRHHLAKGETEEKGIKQIRLVTGESHLVEYSDIPFPEGVSSRFGPDEQVIFPSSADTFSNGHLKVLVRDPNSVPKFELRLMDGGETVDFLEWTDLDGSKVLSEGTLCNCPINIEIALKNWAKSNMAVKANSSLVLAIDRFFMGTKGRISLELGVFVGDRAVQKQVTLVRDSGSEKVDVDSDPLTLVEALNRLIQFRSTEGLKLEELAYIGRMAMKYPKSQLWSTLWRDVVR